MNRRIVAGAAVALGLLLGAYVGSPWWAVHQFREAAIAADVDALDATVDFPALRESLKSQLNVALTTKLETDPELRSNPFAGLGAMLLPTMVDRMVNSMVTPDGLAALVRRGRLERGAKPEQHTKQVTFATGYRSLDRFVVRPISSEGERSKVALIFDRRGLFTWKLIRIELPADTLTRE